MSDQLREELTRLHTGAVDARNGYQEALDDAEGHGLTALFRQMIALHSQNADELARALGALGEKPDDAGSFMTTVHRSIMRIRSLFGGLGESVLPGLVDGEERNVAAYSRALAEPGLPPSARDLLTRQRDRLHAAIVQMKLEQAV